MDARLAVAGFVQIERNEMRQLNGGGWGVWKVIGVVANGWAKLFALGAVMVEIVVGLNDWAVDALGYYWGYEGYAE